MAKTKSEIHNYSGYNPGISILRMLMCFLVIVSYNWEINVTTTGALGWLNYLKLFPVPVFMLVSFFFNEKMLNSLEGSRLWQRILKLFVPLAGWAVIYWCFYKFLQETFYPGYSIRLKDLGWQIATGNNTFINDTMWFQVNLIILTLLFALVILIARKFHNVLFAVLAVGCIVIQYTGFTWLPGGLKSELAGCLGRLPEMLPCAVVGFVLADTNVLNRLRKFWIVTMIISLAGLFLVRRYGLFTDPSGYGFAGIKYIVVAFLLVALFYAPPLEMLPKFIKVIIEWLTKYTLGIYCMHRLVINFLHYFVSHRSVNLEIFTLTDCILVYVICYVICFIIARIPCKWIKMMVE